VNTADDRTSYRITDDAEQVRLERARLHALARIRDPFTRGILTGLGLGPGWRCADVGCGAATMARWMAGQVGPSGRVLAADVDTRFVHALAAEGTDAPDPVGPVGPMAPLEIRTVDVTTDPVGDGEFDLVLARALLQHLHQRETVLDRLVAAAAPGGWVVVGDSDWIQFDAQPVPEPFATLSRLMRANSVQHSGHDPTLARRLLPMLQARGLRDVSAKGEVWTMHGGTDWAEWYVGGLARTGEAHIRSGVLPADFPLAEALAQARSPDFAVLSPISVHAWGRKA
jgi:SAM-dependent methyltransferase